MVLVYLPTWLGDICRVNVGREYNPALYVSQNWAWYSHFSNPMEPDIPMTLSAWCGPSGYTTLYMGMPINTYVIPFLVGWTSTCAVYFDENHGYWGLTHCHIVDSLNKASEIPIQWSTDISSRIHRHCLVSHLNGDHFMFSVYYPLVIYT